MKGQDFPLSADGRPGKGNSFSQSAWRPRMVSTLKYAALTFLFFCVFFLGGFAMFADHVGSLTAPKDMAAADAIIVLTGGQSRIDAAIDLLKSGKGERLLISGVNPTASREALRAATGADRQLFKCCIDIDNAALDTIGNAEESAKWVEAHAYQSIILVTNNYHMPRSLLEMRRLLQKAKLEPYPVVNSRLDDGGWIGKPDAIRVLLTEYTKYVAAVLRGLVQPADTKPGEFTMVDASAMARH